MPFNGSGSYNLLYNWQTDAANGLNISSSRMQGQDADIAAALSLCMTKDGQQTPIANLPMGGFKILNLGAGSTTSTSTDAVNGAQVRALSYKVGEIRTWHGAVASIAATWGNGWQLADGTNGTANLRDQFIVGAGSTYAVNATGGLSTNTLTTAQLPAHNHAITDPGHNHTDPGHGHGITDPGHSHVIGAQNVTGGGAITANGLSGNVFPSTQTSTTGITVNSSGSNLSAATTGITTQNNGSGAVVENKPPYYALVFIEYTGIGA